MKLRLHHLQETIHPRKGTETALCRLLHGTQKKQFIPARGRKHKCGRPATTETAKQFIPARGRKHVFAGFHFLFLLHETIHPRKGTETHRRLPSGTCGFRNNSSPQGDGNVANGAVGRVVDGETIHPRKGTETRWCISWLFPLSKQFIPARGRKLASSCVVPSG